MPGDGPDHEVCLCGSAWDAPALVPWWVPSMRQLIGALAELLTNPGPPDPTGSPAPVEAVAAQPLNKINEAEGN